jgi:uncharacterized membrane protein YbhN (UPF0104 family)
LSLGLFRLVSAVGRILVLTQSFGACCIVILLALGGFIVSRANIPPWWIWGYWLSPFTYALNALSVNEFLAPRWNKRLLVLARCRSFDRIFYSIQLPLLLFPDLSQP